MSIDVKSNDFVSIYVDLNGKCLKGSDANEYLKSQKVFFIGNGCSLLSRADLFKNNVSNGIAVRIDDLIGDLYIPSFNGYNKNVLFLQNLPSIICSYVLDVKEDHLILDMCSAPGGKTTHLAALTKNKAKIIAFEKVQNKVLKMKEFCKSMSASSIECICQDSTKIGKLNKKI